MRWLDGITDSMDMSLGYTALRLPDWRHWLWLATLPLYIMHLRGVWTHTGRSLDKYLPMLVITTCALAVLAGAGFTMYLW